MKILLTGTTTLMSNRQRQRTSTFLSFFPLLFRLLQEMGHEVDWRSVKPGERLARSYDLALLGLQAVNGLAGKQYRYGTLWAATELPHAVVFDDWQVRTSARSLRYKGDADGLSLDDEEALLGDNLWKTAMLGRRELEERRYALEHHFSEIEAVRRSWFAELPLVIAPLFDWGRAEQFRELHPMSRLCAVDPSSCIERMPTTEVVTKQRRWYYAGLKDHKDTLRKMGLGESRWPLVTQMPVAGKRGWGRITEQAVVQMYADSWGVVSVPYSRLMLGTGWWRSRFNFCAQVGSIMLCDRREIGLLDPDVFGLSVNHIEGLTHEGLRQLAEHQRLELERWAPTREQLFDHITEHLQQAAEHGPPIRA